MTHRQLALSSFDECDHCGGLWLSPSTAEAVTSRAEFRAQMLPFDPPPGPGQAGRETQARITYRKCPSCRKAMNRSGYAAGSGLVLDVCKTHGVYFDRGELTRLFSFIESGGLEKARRREAEALREEIRDARRKAISMGGGDATFGPIDQSPAGGTALDLVRWIAELFTAGRDR